MIKQFVLLIAIAIPASSFCQLPTRLEPRHRNIFENEYVRALDVRFGPGDTTLYHEHNTPSVFYTFTKTITTQQLYGRPAGRGSASTIGAPSYDSLGTPRIHRIWNDDTSWFHVMDIELLQKAPQQNPALLQSAFLRLAFNRYLANGYTLQLKPGENITIPASSIGYFIVSQAEAHISYTSAGSMQNRLMYAGHFIWIDKNTVTTITEKDTPGTFMLLQLK